MTWRDNLRAASSEDGFIIAGGSGASLIPQNTNWHDNYMNSFTEDGIKIANLKDAVSQVETLPQEADTGSLYYLTTGANPGMYYYDGTEWVAVGGGGGTSDFDQLTNRPQLNGTAMTSSTNITDFVGTDGTNAGAQGLVPAPTTADVDKFLKSDGTWATAGGGGPTVVQTTGTSTTDVMSQDAVSGLLFADKASREKVRIGNGATANSTYVVSIGAYTQANNAQTTAVGSMAMATGNFAVAIGGSAYATHMSSTALGYYSHAYNTEATAIGDNATASGLGSVAIGGYSVSPETGSVALGYMSGGNITDQGMVDVGATNTSYGYDNTNYRLITGVHDAQNAHDAVTLGQLNALITELQNLGLNVSLQGAGNANQNSGSSEDPGTSAEPEPEQGGGSEQAPTYPYYEGTHVFYLYNGQEVYYDETSPVQDLYYRDGTLAMAEADWCQDEGQGTVYYCGGSASGEEPAEPEEPVAPEDQEAPAEG